MEGQNFLYVTGYDKEEECYILNFECINGDGNYYYEDDFKIYKEPTATNFLFEQLPTFNWSELDGKTLKLIYREDGIVTALYGYEEETSKLYVISESIKR